MSSAITVADSLVDFKSTTREGYTSTSFKSGVKDKEEEEKKKFGGGASKAVADKGKVKLMVHKVKVLNRTLLASFVMVLILQGNVRRGKS